MRPNMILIDMLGYPVKDFNHPMYSDTHVINGYELATISLEGRILWDGIVAASRVFALDELEQMNIGLKIERQPLTTGFGA